MGALNSLGQTSERKVEHGDPAMAQHADLRAFHAVWNTARGEHTMPAKGGMPPKQMKPFLRYVHLYDVVAGGEDFHCRLVGSELVMTHHMDMTGKLISTLPNARIRMQLLEALRRVVRNAQPLYSRFETVGDTPTQFPFVERLLLPLGTGDRVEQVMALTVWR